MSSGARQILEATIEQQVGVTPNPFDRSAIPFSSTSLDAATTKEDSTTILSSRLAQAGSITAVDYTGDIEGEFRFGIYDDFIAAAAYNEWEEIDPDTGEFSLTFGGDIRKTFSILRGYEDINNYHTFRGMHVNTFNLTIPETGIVTSTFGMIGLGRASAAVKPAGTVDNPALGPTFSSVSVTGLKIDDVSTVGTACITTFDFTWDNTAQTQRCLGGGLAIGNVIATLANGTGSFTMAWSTQGAANYEKQFTNQTISMEVEMTDGDGNVYTLLLPKIEITSSLPSGGSGDILSATFEYRVIEQGPVLTRLPAEPPTP